MLDRDWHEGPCAHATKSPGAQRKREGCRFRSCLRCAESWRRVHHPSDRRRPRCAPPIPYAGAGVSAYVRLCLPARSPGLVTAAALVGQVSCAGAALLRSVNESNRARVCISSAGGAPAACAAVRAQSLSDAACLLGCESMCAACVCSATLDRPAPSAAYTAVSPWPTEHTTPSFLLPLCYFSFPFPPPSPPLLRAFSLFLYRHARPPSWAGCRRPNTRQKPDQLPPCLARPGIPLQSGRRDQVYAFTIYR